MLYIIEPEKLCVQIIVNSRAIYRVIRIRNLGISDPDGGAEVTPYPY